MLLYSMHFVIASIRFSVLANEFSTALLRDVTDNNRSCNSLYQ